MAYIISQSILTRQDSHANPRMHISTCYGMFPRRVFLKLALVHADKKIVEDVIGSVDSPVLWSPFPLPNRRNEHDTAHRWRVEDGLTGIHL